MIRTLINGQVVHLLLQSAVSETPALAIIMQSAAMGGYGAAIVNGVVQTGGAIAGLATLAHAAQ